MARQKRIAAFVGVGSTPLGHHGDLTSYELGARAFKNALEDCGIDKSKVDAIITNGTAHNVDAVPFCRYVGLNPKVAGSVVPVTAGHVLFYASQLIQSGVCNVAACVFARNFPDAMTELPGQEIIDYEYGVVGHVATAALGWSQHMARYGTTESALGLVNVAARKHAKLNPEAAFPDPLTLDEYLAQDYLVWPFRPFDISPAPAGGLTLILASPEAAEEFAKPPVYQTAHVRRQATRELENPDHLLCRSMRDIAAALHDATGTAPPDADLTYIYDSTSAVILQSLEQYGFCDEGGSEDFVRTGAIEPGGSVKLNTHGGHLAGGYMQGFGHHVEMVRQLRGECGERQVEGARTAFFGTSGLFRSDFQVSLFEAA